MKKYYKRLVILGIIFCLSVSNGMIVFAGQWQKNETGWWYQNDDGSYPVNKWEWLDGDNDGVAECYYFDGNGYMVVDSEVDGYTINSDGAWNINGKVQKQTMASGINTVDDGTLKLKTDFIKQEYIDCLGKDIDYVNSHFGTEYITTEIQGEDGTTDLLIVSYIKHNISFDLEDNKVIDVSTLFKGYTLFNATKNKYTIEELDTLLGVKSIADDPDPKYAWYTWKLSENPLVELELTGNKFRLSIE